VLSVKRKRATSRSKVAALSREKKPKRKNREKGGRIGKKEGRTEFSVREGKFPWNSAVLSKGKILPFWEIRGEGKTRLTLKKRTTNLLQTKKDVLKRRNRASFQTRPWPNF